MMGDPDNDSHWLCVDNNTHWLGLSICTGYYYYVFYLRYMVTMSSKHLNAQYNLRWPDELKEKIAQSAKEHNRSMNADIVARLEKSFEPELNPTETFEFEAMKRIYLEQSAQIKELRDMLKDLLKKPS